MAALTQAGPWVDAHHRGDGSVLPAAGGAPVEATIGEALAYALDPVTGRQFLKRSSTPDTWARARREVEALGLDAVRVSEFSVAHFRAVGVSVAGRLVCGRVTQAEWGARVAAVMREQPAEPARNGDRLSSAVIEVARRFAAAGGPVASALALKGWAAAAPGVVRTMLRFAAEGDPARFGPLLALRLPTSLMVELERRVAAMRVTGTAPQKLRYETAAARRLLSTLNDPRQMVWSCLASKLNGARALTCRRSNVRENADGSVSVRRNVGSTARPQWSWTPLESRAGSLLRRLLDVHFRELAPASEDYCLLADTRWRDGRVVLLCASERWTASDPPDATAVAILDPRALLVAMLGVEGRGGQVARCRRSDLTMEAETGALLLQIPGEGKKRGAKLLLAPSQEQAVGFALEVGYLAELEAAFRAQECTDYPLFPAGKLSAGRATGLYQGRTRQQTPGPVPAVDERTLQDWVAAWEAVLDVPHAAGRGWHGWRRVFADLYDHWHVSPRVKSLITGHAETEAAAHADTRVIEYLRRDDLRDLTAAQRLLEHARTTYWRTENGPDT
jgi:hypothetical protein